MRKTVSKIITFMLLAVLCLPQNVSMSKTASKDTKKVLSAYASVLKNKVQIVVDISQLIVYYHTQASK